MNTSQSRALETRRKYHVRRGSDIDRVLAKKGLEVQPFPFVGRGNEEIVENVIGIQSALEDPQQVRELVTHALGHYLLHAGNQLFLLLRGDPVVARQWEHQAWAFAYEFIMPARQVEKLLKQGNSDAEIREQFNVSPEFYRTRMDAFREEYAEQILRAQERFFWDESPGA